MTYVAHGCALHISVQRIVARWTKSSGEQVNDRTHALNPRPLVHRRDLGPEIADLKQRLARTRWPSTETVPDWSQGVRLDNAKSLVDYWERDYDWRRFERELNRFPLVHHGHRWAGYPLHPRQVEESERDAPGLDPRMASVDRRVPEAD